MPLSRKRVLITFTALLILSGFFVYIYVNKTTGNFTKAKTNSVWSPSGDWITYVCSNITDDDNDSKSTLFIVRPDGSKLQAITDDSFVPLSPSWSPDGQWIIFKSLKQLVKIRPDGSDAQDIFSFAPVIRSDNPRLSPNGKWVIYTSYADIQLIDLDSGVQTTIFHATDGLVGAVEWSKDSSNQIAFVASSGIYTMTNSGQNVKHVWDHRQIIGRIAFLYDNKSLLVELPKYAAQSGLYRLTLNNGEMLPIEMPNFIGAPSSSPLDKWIVFRGYDDKLSQHIYKARPDGTQIEPISDISGCYPSQSEWFSFDSTKIS
jgi:Tol biopolymer transport system component